MQTPAIVSSQEWEAARQQLPVEEKELTRARDALAAGRRRMPWLAVDKDYEFDGPAGRVSLPGLFEGRRQLIVYRAFFEPGVHGWPDHACPGCSLVADRVKWGAGEVPVARVLFVVLFPNGADMVLAPVLREAVTNILRYSAATSCVIEVAACDGRLRLCVSNDRDTQPAAPPGRADGPRRAAAAGWLT
jgi:hypothetical protein